MMRFEWKKIFERKLNIVAMLSGYILLGICVFNYITQTRFYDEDTQSYIEGMEAFRRNQEHTNTQTDVISEEYITRMIKDMQSYGLDLESDEAYVKIVRPLGDIFYFTAKNYTDMRSNTIDKGALNAVDVSDGAHFYEQRMKKITDYLNLDFSYGNYKEAEKTYWIQKAGETVTPFSWGDQSVMDILFDTLAVSFYFIFVVVICASSVFSSEHENGAASLLLTTKYGKDRLIGAKILVSLMFTVGYLSIGNLVAIGVIGVLLGFSGAGLPVQLWDSVIPYNLTIAEACTWQFLILLLISIAITLVVLLCSARLHSSLATLVIGMVIIIAPAFLPMSRSSGLWNHINCLFPCRVINVKEILGDFISYTLGNHVISYIGMVVIVYSLVSVIAVLFVKKGFVTMK